MPGQPIQRCPRVAAPIGNQHPDILSDQLFARERKHDFGLRIGQADAPFRVTDDHGIGRGFEQRAELQLRLSQNFGLPAQQRGIAAQLDKNADLGAQNLGHNWLEQKIHRAQIVAAEQMFIAAVTGKKQNGRVAGALARTDQLGGLKTVHVRHLHVQQDGREIVVQQMAQGFGTGTRQHQLLAQPLQCRFERHQIVRRVVHQQDLHSILRRNLR